MKQKAQLFFQNINNRIKKQLSRLELKPADIFFKVFLVLLIIVLGYNIQISYRKGAENLEHISQEEEKLNQLLAEGKKLDELEAYYNSPEFRRAYARDSWNLVEPGASLYLINRKEQPQIDNVNDELDPIPLNDNRRWWKMLIVGE